MMTRREQAMDQDEGARRDERRAVEAGRRGAVLAAALALPGVAAAEAAPTEGLIAFKYLHYRDYQNGLDRITVDSPAVYLLLPLGGAWSIEGSLVVDSLSGATPRVHSTVSSASKMSEQRTAGDAKATWYLRRAAIAFGGAYSTEHDYDSRAVSVDGRLSTESNNTTFNAGLGYVSDSIKPNPGSVVSQKKSKRTTELAAGVTQVVTPSDLVQLNLTLARGRGYFDDPYKFNDARPDSRNQTAILLRWNAFDARSGGTLRTSYRYYTDSYKVSGNTIGLEWAQPYQRWLFTPGLRYHSQSAASFYVDPLPGAPFPTTAVQPPYYSVDQRLSGFGAVTAGLKAQFQLTPKLSVDGKFEYYEQRGAWRIGGKGSPGLEPFKANIFQLGFAYKL